MDKTFQPSFGSGQTIAVTTTSARVEIGQWNTVLCLSNTGNETVYVRSGGSTVVATAADYPVMAGQQVTITKSQNGNYIAAVTASSTSSLHAIPGEGF